MKEPSSPPSLSHNSNHNLDIPPHHFYTVRTLTTGGLQKQDYLLNLCYCKQAT